MTTREFYPSQNLEFSQLLSTIEEWTALIRIKGLNTALQVCSFDVVDGLDNAPSAILKLFNGDKKVKI
ncbi:hypothetical protein DSM106972_050610 [Dulcicalothrix desertica PCC 7102]|uniref:Uncharacterized protein n=1 Tax=Dulcicalothrix desertica PCC 7102 TaxID=232991 RepID=A0A3S1D4K7_9CYAN|nr:hypothetical protein [Dulcicalothrix desertica]RUT03422.1 hypothetical protein DSM106972_050610 [Dulcicalothrix desertica PCC 7102]TWH50654.1 hypothetical protein CAL7102_04984 [Dulcicalothrix desertica PCC 7102]